MNDNYKGNVSAKIWFVAEIFISWIYVYLEQIYEKVLNHLDIFYWQYYNELILIQWFLIVLHFYSSSTYK